MAPERPLGVACLGLGRLGMLHARTLAALPAVRLLAVCDVDPARAAEAATGAREARPTADPLEALSTPGVEAVVIATTTDSHADLVTEAASRGLQVFCEKPLALTLADARRAEESARVAGVLLQVGFMRRLDAGYRAAREAIVRGDIGRPLLFQSQSLDQGVSDSERFLATCGGLLVDVGLHDFDLAEWLMGRSVTEVDARGEILVHHQLARYGDVDNAVVTLRFERGGLGAVVLSHTASYGYDVTTTVIGESGAVRAGALAAEDMWRMAPQGAARRSFGHFLERFGPAYRAELDLFGRLARERRDGTPSEDTCPGGREGVRALEIALAARRSLERGQPEAVARVASPAAARTDTDHGGMATDA